MNKADKLPSQYIAGDKFTKDNCVDIRIGCGYYKQISLDKLLDKLVNNFKDKYKVLKTDKNGREILDLNLEYLVYH
jgi:hypothetical protein